MIKRSAPLRRKTPPRRASAPIARRKRPNKVRKTTPGQLAKKADDLWSAIVRRRGFCILCVDPRFTDLRYRGSRYVLQGAHGFSRRYRGTRWELRNGFCLCAGHHCFYTADTLGWDTILRMAWREEYNPMRERAQAVTKYTVYELEAIVVGLQRAWDDPALDTGVTKL